MDRQDSQYRHQKVMKHHAKFKQKSVKYSHLAQSGSTLGIDEEEDDFDFDRDDDFQFMDDYRDHIDMKLTRNRSNVSSASTGSIDSLQTSADFYDIKSMRRNAFGASTASDLIDGDMERKTQSEEPLDNMVSLQISMVSEDLKSADLESVNLESGNLDNGQMHGDTVRNNGRRRVSVNVKPEGDTVDGAEDGGRDSIGMTKMDDQCYIDCYAPTNESSPLRLGNRDTKVLKGNKHGDSEKGQTSS